MVAAFDLEMHDVNLCNWPYFPPPTAAVMVVYDLGGYSEKQFVVLVIGGSSVFILNQY